MIESLIAQAKNQTLPRRALFCSLSYLDQKRIIAAIFDGIKEKDYAAELLHFADDNGSSFKIAYSEAAKKDRQSENENTTGLVRWANLKPQSGNKKVILIENLERATKDAQNALLKLIEEPPSYLYFLATSRSPYSILETIRSRMTMIFLPHEAEEKGEETKDFFIAKNNFGRLKFLHDAEKSWGKDDKRTKAKNLIKNMIHFARVQKPAELPRLEKAHQALAANGNVKLTMLHLGFRH